MKNVLAIIGTVLIGAGCWRFDWGLAAVVVGGLLLTGGIVAHWRTMGAKR